MATKKKAETTAQKMLIPSLSEFLIPKDELEESSYASLEIPSLKISREIQDQASLRHGNGNVELLKGPLEAIFFYQSKIVSCSAKRISDEENICYSTNTDGYSMKGVLCRTECPYKDKDVYKRGYSKKAYFLIREAGADAQFRLVSYKASYATMKDLSGSLNTLRRNLHSKGVSTLAFAAFEFHVAAVPASWKKSIKLPVIDFDRIEFARPLEGDEIEAVQNLHRDFTAFEKEATESRLAFSRSRAEQMQAEIVRAQPAATAPAAAPAPAAEPVQAQTPAEAPMAPEAPIADADEDDDDNLPF